VTGAALLDACFLAGPEIIQLLLDASAEVSERDSRGRTVLHSVCHNRNSGEVLPLLIARGADINAKDHTGATPLHHAAQNSMAWQIETFVNAGADVNARDNSGKTPLHFAMEGNGGPGMTEALLQCKADPNVPDAEGKTPFDYGLLQGPAGRAHNRILERYGGKPRSVSRGRLLPGEFEVELPQGTREGYRLYTSHISSFYDVIGAIHAWYDNDCRSAFGVEKATMVIRSIGDELNRQGGFKLMSDVANEINREYPGLGSRLNTDWNRIGSWHG
jgi:ankyrin repeat protein